MVNPDIRRRLEDRIVCQWKSWQDFVGASTSFQVLRTGAHIEVRTYSYSFITFVFQLYLHDSFYVCGIVLQDLDFSRIPSEHPFVRTLGRVS